VFITIKERRRSIKLRFIVVGITIYLSGFKLEVTTFPQVEYINLLFLSKLRLNLCLDLTKDLHPVPEEKYFPFIFWIRWIFDDQDVRDILLSRTKFLGLIIVSRVPELLSVLSNRIWLSNCSRRVFPVDPSWTFNVIRKS